jgi:hypothetical protein
VLLRYKYIRNVEIVIIAKDSLIRFLSLIFLSITSPGRSNISVPIKIAEVPIPTCAGVKPIDIK